MFLMINEIGYGIDSGLAVAINGLSTTILDWFFLLFSLPGEMGAIWILSALFMIVFGKKLTKIYGLAALLAMFMSDLAIGHTIRAIVDRPRPYMVLDQIEQFGPRWESTSFPSAHADSSFAGAFILSRYYKKFRHFFYGFAALSSLSRVYFGMHYPSDIMVGATIGYLSGLVIYVIYKKKFRAKHEPDIELGPQPI